MILESHLGDKQSRQLFQFMRGVDATRDLAAANAMYSIACLLVPISRVAKAAHPAVVVG